MIGALLTFLAVGLVTLIVAGVVLAVVGTVFTLAFAIVPLLFKAGLILLVGWGVLKLIDNNRNRHSLSAADRSWLESGD